MKNLFEVNKVKLVYKRAIELPEMPKVLNSKDLYNVLKECFDPETLDLIVSFKVLLLSPTKDIIGIMNVSEGNTYSSSNVKLIMQAALLSNASRIIIAHNHTDGDLTIRTIDDCITSQVKKACDIFGIELLDSIIITRESYYSYADNKRIK